MDSTITSPAESDFEDEPPQRRGRGQSVHIQLLEKGKLYEQRKEALREDAIRREMKQVRSVPKVSAHASRRRMDPSRPFWERFQEQEDHRQRGLRQAREAQVESEPKIGPRPHITKKGRAMSSRIVSGGGRTDAWTSRRNAHLEEMRSRQWVEELAEVRPTPGINERSEKLAVRRRRREDAMHGAARGPHYTHADSLLERDRISRLQLWEKHQQRLMDEQPGNPKITPFAAALDRSHLGSACERLYDQSFDREERRSALSRRLGTDAAECYHSPRITAHAATMRRDMPVEDDLIERHNRACRMRDQSIAATIDRERELHVPVINPVSDEIAARLPQTSRERLYASKADYSVLQQAVNASSSTALDPQSPAARRSKGRRRSRSAPAAGTDVDNSFYRRIELRKEQTDKKMETLRESQTEKVLNECSFHPRTNYAGSPNKRSGAAMHHRGILWQQRREERLRDERVKLETAEKESCTFAPNRAAHDLSAASGVAQEAPWEAPPSSQLYGGTGRAWGFDECVERHREARRLDMERQEGVFVTGKGWRNEVTKPREFALGRRDQGRTRVDSLRKPLSPPRRREDDAGSSVGPSRSVSAEDRLQPPPVPDREQYVHSVAQPSAHVSGGVPWETGLQPPAAYPVYGDASGWLKAL
eukprot:TRINITY_DN6557_c0_g1_i2.p1 TRINITY_DN6557_c0_g1~~TRINITY_DN6557_c0_g1_i2.p1  ORF type:complete len:730 (+),score=153.47 TRINITY_DN6557_c0_g1_i2:244-2190(+)